MNKDKKIPAMPCSGIVLRYRVNKRFGHNLVVPATGAGYGSSLMRKNRGVRMKMVIIRYVYKLIIGVYLYDILQDGEFFHSAIRFG